jgi:hypothetical protein
MLNDEKPCPLLYTQDVGGSIPSPPTSEIKGFPGALNQAEAHSRVPVRTGTPRPQVSALCDLD